MKRSTTISTDQEAWLRLQAGDVQGLHFLYHAYSKKLVQFGLNRSNIGIAKDCLQETFLSLWSGHTRLGYTDSPKNYLYSVYRRKIVAEHKQRHRHLAQDDREFLLPIQDEQVHTVEPNLKEAIDKLTDQQKEIVYLKYYQGMDYDEIASIMDMNYQSARNLMSRAIKSLRSKLKLMIFFTLITALSTMNVFVAY